MITRMILIALIATLPCLPAFAASTSPGKWSAFESMTTVPLVAGPTPLLAAAIAKGKKKTVLKIEGIYTDGPYAPTAATARVLALQVNVNGVPAQANTAAFEDVIIDCGDGNPPPLACTIVGTWWLDIDAAEAANPGMFYNLPLTITLSGGDLLGGGLVGVQSMDVSLSVLVVKK